MPYQSQKHPYSGRYAYGAVPRPRLTPPRPPEQPSKKGRTFIVLIAVLLFVVAGSHITASRHASAHALALKQAEQQALTARAGRLSKLDGSIGQIISDNSSIDFSVAIQEIDTMHHSTLRTFGDTGPWDAASTGKLLTAADILRHVAAGKTSLQHQVDGQSIEQLLKIMIVNSDDTAWETLNSYLGHADLARYAASIGITDYEVADNQLAAPDIALIMDKLYNGQLLSSNATTQLLGYLKQANLRDFLVPAVASGDTIYHKVGINNDTVNDAAIITHGSQALVIVIFTNGNGVYDWPDRADMMQQIAKAAMNAYFL